MVKKLLIVNFVASALFVTTVNSFAELPTLSIHTIQYTTNTDGTSDWDTQQVNCLGGIVIHKWGGGRQRIVLYDPNDPDGWGGILVKGENNTTPFDSVNLGDWVSLDSVTVHDWQNKSRGNTILYLDGTSMISVLSTGNPLPEPVVVDVNDAAVVYDPVYETCYVTDHRAEKYEAMYIQVRVVTVGDVNVGKDEDNYSLNKIDDPNVYCWAADYMNIDNPDDKTPHPIVESGLELCSVSGILEQYTNLSYGWDYYQLLTTKLDDFVIEQTADLDGDCSVDFADFSIFAEHWLQSGCTDPNWCGGADLVHDANAVVDMFDLLEFTQNWLEGK
jgi:hypothetical protein